MNGLSSSPHLISLFLVAQYTSVFDLVSHFVRCSAAIPFICRMMNGSRSLACKQPSVSGFNRRQTP